MMPSDGLATFVGSITRIFQDAGYHVEAPGRLEGSSGVIHKVDILCSADNWKVFVDISEDVAGVGAAPVLALRTKMLDSGQCKGALIAVPKALPSARKLSREYRLTLVEAKGAHQAAAFLEKRMLQVTLPSHVTSPRRSEIEEKDPNRIQARYLRRIRSRSVKSSLDLIILLSLNQTALTGYDVIAKTYSNFKILFSPGTVYPILKRLKKDGLITCVDEGRKKVYMPTQVGRLASSNATQEYETIQREILSHLRILGGFGPMLSQKEGQLAAAFS
jgi:DNA-binding PadR family transcriptional regulator